MLRTKYAPRKPSSKLLEKKWQEHNYLLHKYRLRALVGDAGPKPNYHDPSPVLSPRPTPRQTYEEVSPPQKRKALSAHPRAQKSTIEIPTASPSRRPYTSKDRLPGNNGNGNNKNSNSGNNSTASFNDSYSSDDNDSLRNFNSNQPPSKGNRSVNQLKRTPAVSQSKRPNSSSTVTSSRRNSSRPATRNPTQRQQQLSSAYGDSSSSRKIRPATTKPRLDHVSKQPQNPYSDSRNNNNNRPATTKSARILNKAAPVHSGMKTSSARQYGNGFDSGRIEEPEKESRPLTSKERLITDRSGRSDAILQEMPPRKPMVQQWMKPKPKSKQGKKSTKGRYKSEYSRESLNKHFQKHQSFKKQILRKTKPKEPAPPPAPRLSTPPSSESEEFVETDSTDIVSESGDEGEGYVPSPTPTPEPIVEVEKLDMNEEDREAPPTPDILPVVEYPKVEINYTPPSHVLKIVDDAREFSESDWSEDEPVYVLKDGKRGTFIRDKDDKYLLAKTVKEKERKKRHKLNERKKKEIKSEDLIKEIHYINYEADEEEEDEEEEGDEGVLKNREQRFDENGNPVPVSAKSTSRYKESPQDVTMETDEFYSSDTETELESESESEYDSKGEKIEKPPKSPKPPKPPKRKKKRSPVFIHYKSSDDEGERTKAARVKKTPPVRKKSFEETENITEKDGDAEGEEITEDPLPHGVGLPYEHEQEEQPKVSIRDMIQVFSESEEETDEEDKEKLKVDESEEEEELSNLRPETVNDEKYFDAKKVQDDDSDLDEFGRAKGRQRPSSAMFDFLPPLKPDPRLDGGDITNCKNRLSRQVVTIRESLARNEQDDLEKAIDVIIANNSDNRRWLRKIYRDSYLQSLLLDLRKTLPADIASVISYMMIPICEFDAMCLWDALKGLHKDPEVLCEILCTRTNKELEQIRIAYALRYDVELIDHIEDETISTFQRMLMRLASGQREEEKNWTKADAAKEATAIAALLESRGEHCKKKLIEVFCQLPIDMLQSVLNEYKKLKGTELDADLIKTLKGNFQRCIIAIIHYIQNPPNYFVQKLHATHFGSVDDDKGLCRLIISRSEPEMLEMIKQLFIIRYDMSLYDYIQTTCKGPMKGLVMRIVAGQLTDEERDGYQFPPLWVGREDPFAMKRLTFDELVISLLRRSKVAGKMDRVLIAFQEQEDDSSDCPEEEESEGVEASGDEDEGPEEPMNSEEEEEAEERAAAAELQKGLKNISFADEEATEEEGLERHVSVFKEVSFAKASRGILRIVKLSAVKENGVEEVEAGNNDTTREGNEEGEAPAPEEEEEVEGETEGGEHNLNQLNGPVHDPTFTGRDNQQFVRIPFKKAKKKGPNSRATVQGIDMENFDALKDANAIGKAILQKKRNIEGILQFMVTRNNAQRQLIIREFFRRYRRDLVDDLRTAGPRLEEMALALLLGNEIFAAASLFGSLKGENYLKCLDDMIEILCSRQNDEIGMLKRAFNGVFGLSLAEEVIKRTSGYTQRFLLNILEGKREEGDVVDKSRSKKDSEALYEAVIMRPPNANVLVDIFTSRSFAHIAKVCEEFALIRNTDILEIIHKITRGAFQAAIIAIVCVVRDTPMYFCERIYKSMAYDPPDHELLVRLLVSRSEIDLVTIKALFRRTYGRTIHSMIDKDIDHYAKKILLDVVKK